VELDTRGECLTVPLQHDCGPHLVHRCDPWQNSRARSARRLCPRSGAGAVWTTGNNDYQPSAQDGNAPSLKLQQPYHFGQRTRDIVFFAEQICL